MSTIKLGLQKVPVTRGQCYRNCVRVMLKNLNQEDWLLVHGVVHGQGPQEGYLIGHAWLEKRYDIPSVQNPKLGVWMVYDPSNDSFVPRDFYYFIAQPDHVVRYTPYEMAQKFLETEHWGPWDERVERAWHAN
jgi:hypothetical protein